MRIKGHPVHMMLVHFPSALLPVHFVMSIWETTTQTHLGVGALVVLQIGVIGGWLAVITGIPEMMRLVESKKEKAIALCFWHAGINSVAISLFSLALAFTMQKNEIDSLYTLILEAAGVVVMVVGNALGGSLVTGNLKF